MSTEGWPSFPEDSHGVANLLIHDIQIRKMLESSVRNPSMVLNPENSPLAPVATGIPTAPQFPWKLPSDPSDDCHGNEFITIDYVDGDAAVILAEINNLTSTLRHIPAAASKGRAQHVVQHSRGVLEHA